MELKSKSVLITGSGGFIGSHLVERLLEYGCAVRCFVRYNSRGDIGLLRDIPDQARTRIQLITGDLRDSDAVSDAVKGAEVVFHLGSLIAIPYSYVHPREVFETNVMGTLNVMLAARNSGTTKVIHTSTSEVYGTALYVPIDEKHPLQGQSPYSASKIAADKIAESFYDSYDLPVVTIRPFNAYGPRQSARAVIPTIITQALTQDVIRLGSLTPSRDFTYVTDTVEAFIKSAECDEAVGKAFNAGSNFEVTISELVCRILGLIGRQPRIVADDQRVRPAKSEVRRLWADSTLASSTLGWKPQVSLEEGLKRTIDWISAHLDRYGIGAYAI